MKSYLSILNYGHHKSIFLTRMRGRIVKSTGSWSSVRTEDGKITPCKVKGNFRLKGIRSTNPVAVGDWVDFKMIDDVNGIIYNLEKRHNYIIRRSINLSKRGHILASNIDQILIFITLRDPETTKGFIDRLTISAEAYHITPILIFNKADLLDESDTDNLIEWLTIYGKLGYKCIQTSVTENVNLDEVKAVMKGKTSMLAGHSGTGKSSLINSISPSLNLKISDISESHRQGKHTTTFAEMYNLDFDAQIIDTPGIRGFGIIDMDKKELSHYFLEMRALLSECKFNNCQHLNEPECAIKKAVGKGEIAESRFKSYMSIYGEDENENYRTVDY